MRNLILSALILASALQTAVGEVDGNWTYIIENDGATITAFGLIGAPENVIDAVTIPSELGGYAVKKLGGGMDSIFDYSIRDSVTSVNIPNSVLTIGSNAFKYCSGLTGTLTIPNSVTSIGDSAFYYCQRLTSIIIPNSVTTIGDNAFYECRGLTGTLTIPNSVTSIGTYAFFYCTGLTGTLTIPNSVTSIGRGAFSSCSKLTTIIIPNSVTRIEYAVFLGCSSLTTITIPNNVTSIGDSAFMYCRGLTSIIIPNSVLTIGVNAFFDCPNLTSITMPDRYIAQVAQIGISGQVATDYLINALATNDAFVTAVANKILARSGNYGLSVKSELETLATKSELTSSLTQSRTDGINSVLSNPNLWTLYTTSQIQNMAVGDLVLTKNVGGTFTLNYDIQQSTDLQTWTTYEALSLPLEGLPTDKAFVRIKAKQ